MTLIGKGLDVFKAATDSLKENPSAISQVVQNMTVPNCNNRGSSSGVPPQIAKSGGQSLDLKNKDAGSFDRMILYVSPKSK